MSKRQYLVWLPLAKTYVMATDDGQVTGTGWRRNASRLYYFTAMSVAFRFRRAYGVPACIRKVSVNGH